MPEMESLLICVCAARILGSAEVDMPDTGSVDTLRFCWIWYSPEERLLQSPSVSFSLLQSSQSLPLPELERSSLELPGEYAAPTVYATA